MKVTFIRHSCYFVELETCCLLFDYFEGEVPAVEKPLYVFASHSHDDHFSTAVFRLAREGREVTYLLSNDIPAALVPEDLRERTIFCAPHGEYEAGELRTATLESTDMGVAFLVECEGKLLYHAGDLNCWVWSSTPKLHNELMRTQYRWELKSLAGKRIDAAFVPLDPRLQDAYDLGMTYFFEAAQAEAVFPMHMWDDYSVVPRFKADPAHRDFSQRVMDVSRPGQSFQLD